MSGSRRQAVDLEVSLRMSLDGTEEKRVDLSDALFSLVIPVYRSSEFIDKTVKRCRKAMMANNRRYEIILVNDGSPDDSWKIVERLAQTYPEVTSVDLIYNYGQHTANYCGFGLAQGDYIVTLDDDLQNPPEEIEKLIAAAEQGHDFVVGRFETKRHDWKRRFGSLLMRQINNRIFNSPQDFIHTNFRLIKRSIVERILKYRTHYPYTSGLAVMFAYDPVNVLVEHHERVYGTSNYTLAKLFVFVFTIIFSYSKFPMRLVSFVGLFLSAVFSLVSIFILVRGLLYGSQVQGWITIMFLLSFSMSLLFFLQVIAGEYLGRILLQLNQPDAFHIQSIASGSKQTQERALPAGDRDIKRSVQQS